METTLGFVDKAKQLRLSMLDRICAQRIVFHHIPKCGGTSVGRALRKRYILSQATVAPEASFRARQAFTGSQDREALLVDVLDLREQMLLYLLFEDVRCVSAHVRFSAAAYTRFAGRYKFVTILRNPVDRFVSHYRWNRRMTEDHGHIALGFEAFLATERAQRYGAMMVEYFSGLPKEADTRSPEAVEVAQANLARFDVVGHLEDLPAFEADLRRRLGISVRIGHENSDARDARRGLSDLAPEIRARVEAICAPDLAVWASARRAT